MVNSEGFPIGIPRFLDEDKDGILQIGHSKNIEGRIKHFRGAAIERKRFGHHSEADRLFLIELFTNFMEKHNTSKIQYSFKELTKESEAENEEERLLKCYFKGYGEVPPLNANLPDKHIDWRSLKCYP